MQILRLAQVLSLQASGVRGLRDFPSHTLLTVPLAFSHLGGEKAELIFTWEQLECSELHLRMGNEPARSSQVRHRGQTNMGPIIVGICCRQPSQEEAQKAFFRQLEPAWHSCYKWLRSQQGEALSAGPHTWKQEITSQGSEGWGSKLSFSNRETVEFRILRGRKKAKSRIVTLALRRAIFGRFRDPLGRISWRMVLKRRAVKVSLLIFQVSPPPR